MDRQCPIVERGLAFGLAEDLERDLPNEISGTRNLQFPNSRVHDERLLNGRFWPFCAVAIAMSYV
jgi:hypothetical protein